MSYAPQRQARFLAVQGSYQWLLTQKDLHSIYRDLVQDSFKTDIDHDLLKRLLIDGLQQADHIQKTLQPCLDREWSQLTPMETAVLYIGAAEMILCPEQPYKVVIAEFVSLSKIFGAENGHKFVNAVLDKLANQM